MKIILDTNVYISALVFNKKVQEFLEIVLELHEVYISPFILNELEEKLATKFSFTKEDISHLSEHLKAIVKLVEPTGELSSSSRDIDDNNILHLADFIQASVIITGDKDLLSLKKFNNTQISTLSEFHSL
ncbi:MAG: putative toxin-antitoxin system toxin component, PIN family [Chitinophaga sp.]|jgi:putative PIN family toxin of toxin-antitoxin system|nr:putative toxin-antitoxin system toxin component, PIN family [Chitinophaga sp.]